MMTWSCSIWTKINAGTVKEKGCHKHKGSLRRSAASIYTSWMSSCSPSLQTNERWNPSLRFWRSGTRCSEPPCAKAIITKEGRLDLSRLPPLTMKCERSCWMPHRANIRMWRFEVHHVILMVTGSRSKVFQFFWKLMWEIAVQMHL